MTSNTVADAPANGAQTPPLTRRTLVMGIVNVTPDSFSDGGRWFDADVAIGHAKDLVAAGADMLDIGAESTRPGYSPVAPDEQIRRLLPVLKGLTDTGVPLSVDTMSADVANAAVAAGATIINDVSGGLCDPAILPGVAAAGVDYICQLWTGWPSHHARMPEPWTQTRDELLWRRDACLDAGIAADHIVLDPGLGFGKQPEENWQILRNLLAFAQLGHRVLIGASRKRFLTDVTGPIPFGERDCAGAAITAWCAQQGIWAVRVHNVTPHRQTIDVMDRLIPDVTSPSQIAFQEVS
ncbi:MAG: dihydropteroate synthase [Propionibacteriaceae bacterium]|nr:dihydropteroate synthase [Propionibacteriaceae bacterium]